MSEIGSIPHARGNIVLIGNYLPRQCGIATFTSDLLEAISGVSPGVSCYAVAMNDVPDGYDYPPQVRFEVNDKRLRDYHLAADFLNVHRVDVVCLQHEYGIFGGKNGEYILSLLRELRMPVVTTLHTVLARPTLEQRAIVEEIGEISDRLVVMNQKAREILLESYGVCEEKIALIHHGIPDLPFIDPNYYRDQFGVEGRKVLLSFGLLSPGKGIEYMIDALPRVVREHPETAYLILGATHPNVLRESGEAYRLSLQRRARDLGVERYVFFHNRFVELEELCEFLGAADIYVTPYLNKEQIVSGTLAYALGAGKACVSTPYWYAVEMLAEGRGRLVPFRDSDALADQVIDLLSNETERHVIRKRAYAFGRQMVWKEVARRYLDLFAEVTEEQSHHPRPPFQARSLHAAPLEMPQPKFDHLLRLTDDVGILQHAKYLVPDRIHGYCTDDNARALIAVLMAQEFLPEGSALRDLDYRYLSFLYHAFNEELGRFRNFMGYDRRWLEEKGSEDSHGRAVWALGTAIGLSRSRDLSDMAMEIFGPAVSTLTTLKYPRAWAFGLVGIHAYLRRFSGDSDMRRARERLANRLFDLYRANATKDWPWIEDLVTYDNGKISQALLMSGQWMQRGDMIEAGLTSLEWLFRIQTDPRGHLVPVGNRGWFRRGGEKARFDQQPLEAQSLLEACVEAHNITQDERWIRRAHQCLEWFLGRNDMDVSLSDHRSGGCCDGLTANGTNRNQGAEATLAWLLSLMHMYIHNYSRAARATPRITLQGVVAETATHAQSDSPDQFVPSSPLWHRNLHGGSEGVHPEGQSR